MTEADTLRNAYYGIVATLYARCFEFTPSFDQIEDDHRHLVERDAARRHGEARFVQRFAAARAKVAA